MAGPLLVRESGATSSVHGLTVAHSGSRPIQCRLAAATSGRARARWFGAPWHLWVRTRQAADFHIRGGRPHDCAALLGTALVRLGDSPRRPNRSPPRGGLSGQPRDVRDPRRPEVRSLRRDARALPGKRSQKIPQIPYDFAILISPTASS